MFCIKCGQEMEENTKVCSNCGFDMGSERDSQSNSKSDSVIGAKKSKRGLVIIISMAAALVLLIGIFLYMVSFGGYDRLRVSRLCDLGDRYLSELDYEQAAASYHAAIEIDPKAEDAYIGLADAYIGMEDYESAIESLEQGIEETGSKDMEEYLADIQSQLEQEQIGKTDKFEQRNDGWENIYQEKLDSVEEGFYGTVFYVDSDLDDTNNIGIPSAYVYVTDADGTSVTYYTDEEGHYNTGALEKGTYSLYYYTDGCVGYYQETELQGRNAQVDVYLESDTETVMYGNIHVADEDMDYSNNLVLPDAAVTLEKLTGSNPYQTSVLSDEYGQYNIEGLWPGVYRLTISKEGYLTVEENVVIYEGQSVNYNAIIEMIDSAWNGTGTASGTVYDALTGMGVPDLTLLVRAGINNTDGSVLEIIETGNDGYYQTSDLESGNYCIEIVDNREGVEEKYINSIINIKILGGLEIGQQDGTVSNSILSGQLRIVLTWGYQPYDLDSHLQCDLDNGRSGHICYFDPTFYQNGEIIADLDLDDIESYGPETITVYVPEAGEYTYGVHNFSGGAADALSRSGACVRVYMEHSTVPSYVFYVPNEPGYYWEVFRYDSETGALTPTNIMDQSEYMYY